MPAVLGAILLAFAVAMPSGAAAFGGGLLSCHYTYRQNHAFLDRNALQGYIENVIVNQRHYERFSASEQQLVNAAYAFHWSSVWQFARLIAGHPDLQDYPSALNFVRLAIPHPETDDQSKARCFAAGVQTYMNAVAGTAVPDFDTLGEDRG